MESFYSRDEEWLFETEQLLRAKRDKTATYIYRGQILSLYAQFLHAVGDLHSRTLNTSRALAFGGLPTMTS